MQVVSRLCVPLLSIMNHVKMRAQFMSEVGYKNYEGKSALVLG